MARDERRNVVALVVAALGVIGGALVPIGVLAASASGCGDDVQPATDGGAEGDAAAEPKVETLFPDAAPLPGETECKVVITTGIPITNAKHVELCSHVEYATNPPSGGPHWPTWALFTSYGEPVPREMYVHNLEHGGVVIAYRCKDGCPDVVSALEVVRGTATDPFCIASTPPARTILTPDPELDAPIAAAAWGATYVATCLDTKSLADFVATSIGHGTEAICSDGKDPNVILAGCGIGAGSGGGGSGSGGGGAAGAGGGG